MHKNIISLHNHILISRNFFVSAFVRSVCSQLPAAQIDLGLPTDGAAHSLFLNSWHLQRSQLGGGAP